MHPFMMNSHFASEDLFVILLSVVKESLEEEVVLAVFHTLHSIELFYKPMFKCVADVDLKSNL